MSERVRGRENEQERESVCVCVYVCETETEKGCERERERETERDRKGETNLGVEMDGGNLVHGEGLAGMAALPLAGKHEGHADPHMQVAGLQLRVALLGPAHGLCQAHQRHRVQPVDGGEVGGQLHHVTQPPRQRRLLPRPCHLALGHGWVLLGGQCSGMQE